MCKPYVYNALRLVFHGLLIYCKYTDFLVKIILKSELFFLISAVCCFVLTFCSVVKVVRVVITRFAR